jgi:hypothetical protein
MTARPIRRGPWAQLALVAAAITLARVVSAQTAAPAAAPASPAAAVSSGASASPPATAAPSPGDDGPAVVTVRGSRQPAKDLGGTDLRAQDVRAVPGTFGDPFQSIQALPGVVPMVSGLPYFYVRGAPPADTGYFIDGIPLPALFHIGPGPSVIPGALVEHIDFFPSTAPAQYGRFAGGIIAATTKPPATELHGEGEVRLFDASAFVEGPVGSDTSLLAAGRYGYPNLLLGIFAPNLSLSYWDYTLRVTHRLTPVDTLSLFAIGAYDHEEDSAQDLTPVDSQFHRVDLRLDHHWSGGSLRLATTIGHDRTATLFTDANQIVTDTSGRVRLELEQRLDQDTRLSAGVDANVAHYDYGFTGLGGGTVPVAYEQVGGAYFDAALRPIRGVDLDAGVRFDAYRASGKVTPSVDPKLAARIAIAPGWTWVSTFGAAHQQPAYVIPVPGLQFDPSTGLQGAYQISEGVETQLPLSLRSTVTAFYHADRNTDDFVGDCGTLASNCNDVNRVDGRTYGLEVLLRRALTERFSGWLSYTLSRAERWIGSTTYLSPFDRTHVFSAVTSYDFGNGYRAGVRATYYTGRPDIPSFSYPGSMTEFEFSPGQVPQHRLPDFFRIDARFEKRWELGHHRWISAIVEFFDANLAREAVEFQCNVASGLCTAQRVGPIALPSIGVDAGF